MEDMPSLQSWIFGAGGLIGTIATAVATIFLWRVTSTLAVETTRMAEAAAQPHIVITLSSNRWSMRHFDICIENTGNATAYDIKSLIDPPLKNGEARRDDAKIPFSYVSVLKPGQRLTSYLSEYNMLKGKEFLVDISWSKGMSCVDRQVNLYTLSILDHEGMTKLGDDPVVDIARHLKGLDESVKSVFKNHRSINVEVQTAKDRRAKDQQALARLEAFKARQQSEPRDQNRVPPDHSDVQE